MKFSHVIVRYGELGTKGKNKNDFINTLYKNVCISLKDIKNIETKKTHDRIYVTLNDADEEVIAKRLSMISGIQNFSFANKVEVDVKAIEEEALRQAKEHAPTTFKVVVKRADKTFPLNSDALTRDIATVILKYTEHKVDIHNPGFYIRVEIRDTGCFVFSDVIKASGGLPLGILNKALMLTSGGIDSPVAIYMMLKRGVKVEAIHFASPPYTSPEALTKVTDILAKFTDVQEVIKLHVIPFTKLQEAIYRYCDESYAITIMRRMMYRISERIALKNNCVVLGGGESIGQVASQTLESMAVINEVITMPMIRPLATFDKLDIIEIAKKIDTYNISIRPHIDCCTIFTPVNPTTKPKSKVAVFNEAKFDFEQYINECVENDEIIYVKKETELREINEFL
jgi:thiamine biosynthesis protein ThiI